jgi:DNA (cytosine-5)-methyltransferase 1
VSGDTKRLEDPRASTLGEFMRVLEEALPRAFMLENVYGLTYEGKDEGMVFLKDRLSQINKRRRVAYSFTWKVLNAAHYGVPQIRERVFLIGSREGTKFEFPFPTHADTAGQPQRTIFDTPPYRTAWDAIGDLNEADHGDTLKVGGRWAGLLPSIPEGQNYLWHTERGGGSPLFRWRSRYWSMLLKLAKNRPSWTIQAQPGSAIGPFHWKNRRLSMREMCRIQTFPDDYEILGGITSVQKQLGNAVPSAITEMLGLQIRMQLLGDQVRSDELSLVPPVRDHCPAPEPLSRIPTRYRASATLGTSRSAGAA